MTFAFVTFRVELQLGVGLPFETSYQFSAVLCSMTNFIVAELIIRRGPARSRRRAAAA